MAEYFDDFGTCESHYVGMVRETPIGKSGEFLRDNAKWSSVNPAPSYNRAMSLWEQGKLQESLRFFGPSVEKSDSMRHAVGARVKFVMDADPAYRASRERIHVPKGDRLEIRAAPHGAAKLVQVVHGDDPHNLLKLHRVGDEGHLIVGSLGNWDMVYDASTVDVGFVHRIPGLGHRAPLDKDADSLPAATWSDE